MSHIDPRNPANAAALRSFHMQNKIRHDTMKLNEQFADLSRWEKSIKRKDEELQHKSRARQRRQVPVRGSSRNRSSNTVRTHMKAAAKSAPLEEIQKKSVAASKQSGGGSKEGAQTSGSAAKHTYDKGYKKWEKFDVEKALNEVDVEDVTAEELNSNGPVPAHVVSGDKPKEPQVVARTRAPIRSAPSDIAEIFEEERKKGNGHFGRGEFSEAIKCYTKCIGYDSRNPIVYSNRAAAFLKAKEYLKARSDCDSALRLDPSHSKSLLRRATANNFLGRHRAALRDLSTALEVAPTNKRLKSELQKTKELHRTSIRKAPRWQVDVSLTAGPTMPRKAAKKPIRIQEPKKEVKSGLKAINAVDDDMEDVPINRKKKKNAARAAEQTAPSQEKPAAAPPSVNKADTQAPADTQKATEAAVEAQVDTSTLSQSTGAATTGSDDSNMEADVETKPSEPRAASPSQRAAAAAAKTKAAAQARLATIEKLSSPKTSYEFLNCWNGLRDVNERAHYLRLIPTKNLKSVFKTVPDADVFSNILEALTVVASGSSSAPVSGVEAEPAKPKPKRAIVYLKKIAASRRFDMAVMLLSKTDQQAVRDILSKSSNVEDAAVLAKKYMI